MNLVQIACLSLREFKKLINFSSFWKPILTAIFLPRYFIYLDIYGPMNKKTFYLFHLCNNYLYYLIVCSIDLIDNGET
jgi:hypothetical protein